MQSAFPPLTPVVRAALALLFASFVAQTLVFSVANVDLFGLLALWPGLGPATAWQWATHVLVEMPSDRMVINRALALLFVYFWIAPFELEFGRRSTLVLLGLSVVAGALLPLLFGLVASPPLASPYAGASALTWAGIGALAIRTRGAPLNWVLLPTMNAWALALVFLVMDALQCAWAGTPTPLLGSLGGFAAGIWYTRRLTKPRRPKKDPSPKRRGGSHLRLVPGGQSESERPRWLN